MANIMKLMTVNTNIFMEAPAFIIILSFLSVFPRVGGITEIFQLNDLNNCSTKQYYDMEAFTCASCRPGFVKTDDGMSCKCIGSNRIFKSLGGFAQQFCIPCKPTEYVSKDRSVCVPRNCFNNTSGKTSCAVCRKNQIIVTHSLNSSMLPVAECLTCSPGSLPSSDRTYCRPCSIRSARTKAPSCDCERKQNTLIDDMCIPTNFTKNISVYEPETSSGEVFKSKFFDRYFIQSNYLCTLQNSTACQILANMCVMSMYNSDKDSPCSRWSKQTQARPVLFYGEDEAYSVLYRKKIPVTFSLRKKSELNRLEIVAVSISPEGKISGPINSSSHWLLPCRTIWKYTDTFHFATNFRHKCTIGAQQLATESRTIFYEPYLKYTEIVDGKVSPPTLYAIPILIRGKLSNFNKDNDINTWQLVKRFFMFDKTSGETTTGDGISNLKYFRYPKKLELKIRIRRKGRDERNKIYPPLLVLDYGELNEYELRDDVDVTMVFNVNYELDGAGMLHGMEIAVGSLSAFATLYSILQSWSQSRRSGKLGLDVYTVLQFFVFASGNLANSFFVVAFGASVFSFLLYNTQKAVYTVPPSDRDEAAIQAYVIVAFSLKVVELVAVFWRQITADIFFVDWEKPTLASSEIRVKTPSSAAEAPVSFWRPYFVANEWNEIQTMRKISLPAHLLGCIFILEVFGVSSCANTGVVHSDQSIGHATSQAYRLALGGLIFLLLYFTQLMAAVFIYERYITNSIQDFMDVCSIGNMSMLLLDAQLHGYYLHGRCVHASCDTDARGLQSGLPNRAFVMRCTPEFRLYYSRLSYHMTSQDIKWQWQHHQAASSNKTNLDSSTLTGLQTSRRSASKSLRRDDGDRRSSMPTSALPPVLENREQSSRMINKFLTAFFDHALEDLDYEVREKRLAERLLDVELINEGSNKSLLLYNTTGDPQSFQRAIWYGQEWTLATFDLYLFCFVQLMSGSYILATLINVMVWKILSVCRQYGGKKNLAKKTLIDERFLI